MQSIARLVSGHFHYGWVVAGVLFAVLLTVAGVRSTASVLIVPLEQAFGWSRATISGALSICLFLYGLMGPFAGAIALRIGIRKTIMLAVSLLSATVGASTAMTEPWQFYLTWGVFVGLGSGSVALVMGAIVASRWFVSSRGLVMGILSASTATGQLVFLPSLAALATQSGWQPVAWVIALALACLLPLVWGLVPERPEDVGLTANGAGPAAATAPARNPILVAFDALAIGARSREFWLLAGSFFICGLSTNGLVGTHLIAACFDHGIPEVQAAGLLALIGIFDLIGTTLSGWLSDRYDNRWLLFWYYGLRGLSLMFLPYSGFTIVGLT
ncbi:MAG: MFS transporter, partial [Alphaproteobacteria bacterium]|nr:MFS transporter [Alphaproteobacteria bacterium]